MKRKLIGATSLALLFLTACGLWIRGRTGIDDARWTYDRYLSDGRPASSSIGVTSDRRLWFTLRWGSAPPFNGQLVYGYHINADQSGGKPRFSWDRYRFSSGGLEDLYVVSSDRRRSSTDETGMSGWGPLRWQDFQRSGNGEQSRSLTVGVSHWLLVGAALLIMVGGVYLPLLFGSREKRSGSDLAS